jgi:hypothetical protein
MKIIKRISPFLILLASSVIQAKDTKSPAENKLFFLPRELEIELALTAGPEHIRADATVYIFTASGYEKVHTGKNGFTCFVNRDGFQNGEKAIRPTCWDAEGTATIVPVMLRVGELIVQGASAEAVKADIESGFQSKRFSSPKKSGIAYMLKGDVMFDEKTQKIETVFHSHYMLYAPGVSNKDLGVTEDALRKNPSLPFIYDGYSGGTRTAYIIMPASNSSGHTHR